MDKVSKYINKINVFFDRYWKISLSILIIIQITINIWLLCRYGIDMGGDTGSYINPAKSFLNQGIMLNGNGNGIPILFRTPGYPLIISIFYKLFGENNLPIIILQIIMSVMIIIMIYYMVSIYINRATGILACVLYLSDFPEHVYTVRILTDLPFSFFVTLALFLLVKYVNKKKMYNYILACIVINYAMLVRPNIMYFNMILAIVLAALAIIRKINWKKAVIYIVLFVMSYGGWSARNMYYYGAPMFTSIRDESTYAFYAPLMYQKEYKCSEEEALKYFESLLDDKYPDYNGMSRIQQVKAANDVGTTYIREHFKYYLYINIIGLFKEMFGPNGENIDLLPVSSIVKLLIKLCVSGTLILTYLIYGLGFFVNVKRWQWIDWLILILTVYFMASTAVLGYNRFRMAFYPICVVGAFISWRKNEV